MRSTRRLRIRRPLPVTGRPQILIEMEADDLVPEPQGEGVGALVGGIGIEHHFLRAFLPGVVLDPAGERPPDALFAP